MNWTIVVLIVAAIVVFLMLKGTGQISSQDARKHLKNGALVIDVRSTSQQSAF